MLKNQHMTYVLKAFNLEEENSIYLSDYGHIGQIDQILSLKLALRRRENQRW